MTTRKKTPKPIAPPSDKTESLPDDAVMHLKDFMVHYKDPDLLAQKVSFRLGRSIQPSQVKAYLEQSDVD